MTTMATLEHVRAPRPLRFGTYDPEWDMGQSTRHFKLCVLLWETLRRAVGPGATVGCDNFVYFDGADDAKKCAPDAFVKLGVPDADFSVWKTWERGAPELCIEILSPSDTKEPLSLADKIARFETIGAREVITFDVDAPPGSRIRAWDRIDDDLVERVVHGDRTRCATVGKWLNVGEVAGQAVAPILSDDEEGREIVLSNADAVVALEAALRESEAKLQESEAKLRESEAKLRESEARVAALEAKLRGE